ncbi:type VI secretion system tube protein Hcp [Myxococcota bacterium]|nr:type VI secretion system tube protein Hcp [Myxococcota bacterium]
MLRKSLLFVVFLGMYGLAGCDEGPKDEALGVFLQTEEPGANCEHGGVSASLPDSEIIYVCDGADGAVAAVTEQPPGDRCPEGGIEVHYAGSILVVCSDQAGSVTVTPVPAGPSCPAGGLAVTDAGGTSYICNEEAMNLAIEPPGENCPQGGVAVTDAFGAHWYVCHGASPAFSVGSLCPEGTLGTDGTGEAIYAFIEGETQGIYPGGATAPDGTVDAIPVWATCHSITSPTDLGTGNATGKASVSPYFLILKAGDSLTGFYNSFSNNELIQAAIRVFSAADPTISVALGDGRILSVEQLTLPDPSRPGTYAEFLRVGIGYQSFILTYEETGDEVTVPDVGGMDGPGFDDTYAPETGGCVISRGAYPLKFMSLSGIWQGNIEGGVTVVGEETSIQVHSVCQAAFSPGFPLPTGKYMLRTLVLTKSLDQASPHLMQALINNELLDGMIRFYTLDQFDREQRYYAILLTDARVIGIEEYTQGGSRFERVELVFEEITHFWDKNGASATLYWDGPPEVK